MAESKFQKFATNIKTFYAGSVVALGLLITTVTFVIKDKNTQLEVEVLKKSNETLVKEVATLQGAMDGVNNAVKLFLDNSPALLNYKVTALEKKLDECCPTANHTPTTTPTTFTNRTPQ